MNQEELIEYLRDKKKINLRHGMDQGYKKNGKHISIFWVDEEGLFQIGYHNIQGDVVITELEFWVDKDWNVKRDNDAPDVPNCWYFPPYVDRVVHEMTSYKKNEPITF